MQDSLKQTFIITLLSLFSFDVTLRHSPRFWVGGWYNISFKKCLMLCLRCLLYCHLEWRSAFSSKGFNSHLSIPIPMFKFFRVPCVSALFCSRVLDSVSFQAVKFNTNVLKDDLTHRLFSLFCFLCIFPLGYFWGYFSEYECGIIQRSIRSPKHPQ